MAENGNSSKRKSPDELEGPPAKREKDETHAGPAKVALGPQAQAVFDRKVEEGVITPATFDSKAMEQLCSLSESEQASVLNLFFDSQVDTIKNPSAYLCGVIRSTKKVMNDKGARGVIPKTTALGRKLEGMYSSGVLQRGELDDKMLQRLQTEPLDIALFALDLFAQHKPVDCRKPSAFLTSQINIAHERNPAAGRRPPQGPGMPTPPRGPMRGSGPPLGGPMGGGPPVEGPPGTRDYTEDQLKNGVRVHEFQTCSDLAKFIPPFPAKLLQDLFDDGVELVDLLDEGAWRQLASLSGPEMFHIIRDVGNKLSDPKQSINKPNAFFTAIMRKQHPDIMQRVSKFESNMARRAGGGPGPGAEPPGPPRRMGAGKGMGPGMAGPQPETRLYDAPHGGPGGPGGPGQPGAGPVYGYGSNAGQPVVVMQPGGASSQGVVQMLPSPHQTQARGGGPGPGPSGMQQVVLQPMMQQPSAGYSQQRDGPGMMPMGAGTMGMGAMDPGPPQNQGGGGGLSYGMHAMGGMGHHGMDSASQMGGPPPGPQRGLDNRGWDGPQMGAPRQDAAPRMGNGMASYGDGGAQGGRSMPVQGSYGGQMDGRGPSYRGGGDGMGSMQARYAPGGMVQPQAQQYVGDVGRQQPQHMGGRGSAPQLTQMLQHRIQEVARSSGGLLQVTHFDMNVCNALAGLPEDRALQALETVRMADKRGVGNPTQFVLNIISAHY